jgi:hypothetical protein
MTTTPPGWYDDGHGAKRWWDGLRWTEHVASPEATASAGAGAASSVPAHDPAPVSTATLFPAAAPDAGPPPPPERKSNLWIVWVVVGVIVLGALIAALVVIPPLLFAASGQGGQATDETVADADQQAAVATVELYDHAWQNADCEAYFTSTSEDFRAESGLTDCSAFETSAEEFSAGTEDYGVEVTDVSSEESGVLVTTTETYTALVGEDGETLDEPNEESVDWVYVVVADGDDWVIDSIQ